LGHLHYGDSRESALFYGIGLGAYTIAISMAFIGGIMGAFSGFNSSENKRKKDDGSFNIFAIVFFIPIIMMFLFRGLIRIFNLLFNFLISISSRKKEYRADMFAAKAGFSKGAILFFEKILDYSADDPLLNKFFDSHPDSILRIGALEKYQIKIEKQKSELEKLATESPSPLSQYLEKRGY
jgi:Zn-dependent protease with chaperone function